MFNLLIFPAAFSLYFLHRHQQHSLARCLDGSPAALFLEVGSLPQNVLIYFDSGGLCAAGSLQQTFQQCYRRSKTGLGSSANYPENATFIGHGLLSPLKQQNPYFWNWTKVFVAYCDGSQYQGFHKDPVRVNDRDLYFRGYYNNIAQLQFLNQSIGLYNASKLVLTGVSAGGISTLMWSNYVYQRMLNKEALFSMPDSGVFLIDYTNPFTGNQQIMNRIRPFFQFLLAQTQLSVPECNNKGLDFALDCFNGVNLIPYLKGRWLIIESQYDQWSVQNILGIQCTGKTPGTLTNCSSKQIKAIQDYRLATLEVLNRFKSTNYSGIWSPSCIQHGFEDVPSFNSDDFRIPSSNGIKLSQAMWQFMKGTRSIWMDSQGWPGNKGCSGSKLHMK